ncbi:hypothetical protein J6590_010989 [Homalodisca vitripennis]|nr:hypothetical protein J6590_010989 [Homalodisca vitripennis]
MSEKHRCVVASLSVVQKHEVPRFRTASAGQLYRNCFIAGCGEARRDEADKEGVVYNGALRSRVARQGARCVGITPRCPRTFTWSGSVHRAGTLCVFSHPVRSSVNINKHHLLAIKCKCCCVGEGVYTLLLSSFTARFEFCERVRPRNLCKNNTLHLAGNNLCLLEGLRSFIINAAKCTYVHLRLLAGCPFEASQDVIELFAFSRHRSLTRKSLQGTDMSAGEEIGGESSTRVYSETNELHRIL